MAFYPALAKCCIAVFLFLQVVHQVSAFTMPPAAVSAGKSGAVIQNDFSCYASKRENCPGKTAFDSKSNIGGIGGLNINQANRKIASKKNPSSTPKKNVKKSNNKSKTTTKSVGVNPVPKADIDWGKIALAFLTPWRNPNSIFLYLLIIVSILGKVNEN